MFDEDLLKTVLTTARYGRSLDVRAETASTNDDAAQAAYAGAASGHVVIADSQRAGRGSHGRVWASPKGTDLYLSIVDRPMLALAALPPLTLAVGLGVADTLVESLPQASDSISVKWPNDVWIDGKKCAGILVEASSTGDRLQSLVIGIGLNINRTEFPSDIEHPPTSMRLADGREHGREALAASLLGHVERWVDRFVAEGPRAIAQALQGRLALRGKTVSCGDVLGTLSGVADNGALIIVGPHGPQQVVGGRLKEVKPWKA